MDLQFSLDALKMVSKEEEDPGLLWCVFYLLGSEYQTYNDDASPNKTAITYHNYFETLSDEVRNIFVFFMVIISAAPCPSAAP